jgi:hypothetical protein
MRIAILLCLAIASRNAAAQASDMRTPGGALVTGVVRDSITRKPLAGAFVQLVSNLAGAGALTAVSDSLGRFAIRDAAPGRYAIGFVHPMLDSLGLEPPQHELSVTANAPVQIDLGIPSAERIRASICPRSGAAIRTVMIGFVRDARDGTHVAGASLSVRWTEVSFSAGKKPELRSPQLLATSAANGWFAICDAPSSGVTLLSAGIGSDSSDVIELEIPREGFLRRDLYVGRARTTESTDSTPRIRHGEGRLSGNVVAALDGRLLGGSLVGIVNGPQTRANERGEWALMNVPAGTRMLEVRAVGYYPARRAVDVLDGAPPVRIVLSTFKAVLDTVRIKAAQLTELYRNGFEERRRTGQGRYLTQIDIERRNPVSMTQLLRAIPGIRIDRMIIQGAIITDSTGVVASQTTTSDAKIRIRGSTDDWCYPAIYIDGQYMRELDADDLDGWMRPEGVLGIEVYAGISAPLEFQPGMTGCGTIVIWTNTTPRRPK